MKKVWIDLETGGLNSKTDAVLQIAVLIENEQGKVVDKFESLIRPPTNLLITDEALNVNGLSIKQIQKAPFELVVMDKLVTLLNKHKVSKYEPFEFYGYNSRFDIDFIFEMFKRTQERYNFWSYFNFYDVDVFALVKILGITGKRFDEKKKKNVACKKLKCICDLFGIKFKEHDALEDIKATRKLYKKLVKKYLK